jgi:hypothetical protein
LTACAVAGNASSDARHRVHPLHVTLVTNGRELGAGRGAWRVAQGRFFCSRPALMRSLGCALTNTAWPANRVDNIQSIAASPRPAPACSQASQRPCAGVIARSDNRHQLTLRHARIGLCCSPNAGASMMEHESRVHAPHAPMRPCATTDLDTTCHDACR